VSRRVYRNPAVEWAHAAHADAEEIQVARQTTGEAAGDAYSIRSVHRVCDILDLLKDSPAAALPQIAEAAQLPKTSAFRYLATLESRHYVQRDPTRGSYRLGTAFLDIPAQRLEMMAKTLRPFLEQLAVQTGETINLGVLDGRRVLYLDVIESPRAVRLAARRGGHDPLHSSSLGKALAAQLTEAQVRAILRTAGMPAQTPTTITDPDVFLEEVKRVAKRGYAIDEGENEPDGRCVGVPLRDAPVLAAVSLSAPSSRFPAKQVPKVAARLTEAAEEMVAALRAEAAVTSA
jgi:IclR family acetate operon transcriptional repressor